MFVANAFAKSLSKLSKIYIARSGHRSVSMSNNSIQLEGRSAKEITRLVGVFFITRLLSTSILYIVLPMYLSRQNRYYFCVYFLYYNSNNSFTCVPVVQLQSSLCRARAFDLFTGRQQHLQQMNMSVEVFTGWFTVVSDRPSRGGHFK